MTTGAPSPGSTELIARHTLALADIGRQHDLATPVPTCGEWTLADLVWHLAEVQDFWGRVIDVRPEGPGGHTEPVRPADEALADLLTANCHRLVELLDRADPSDPAWSWSPDQSVGFTIRRQTHEALVHHVDGILAVGETLPAVDRSVAADGVDELATVMLSGVPEWATFDLTSGTIRLDPHDTPDSWTLAFGRMTGTSPTSGKSYDIDALELLDDTSGRDATTTISGRAIDIDLWLWGRSAIETVTVTGRPAGADRLRTIVTESTQ